MCSSVSGIFHSAYCFWAKWVFLNVHGDLVFKGMLDESIHKQMNHFSSWLLIPSLLYLVRMVFASWSSPAGLAPKWPDSHPHNGFGLTEAILLTLSSSTYTTNPSPAWSLGPKTMSPGAHNRAPRARRIHPPAWRCWETNCVMCSGDDF